MPKKAKVSKTTTTSTDKPEKVTIAKTKKKPRFSKKQLEKALGEERDKSKDLLKKLTYLQAEYENYVKSLKKHESQVIQQANRDLILRLLPVLDDLERSQIMVPRIQVNEPFIAGLDMIVNNFQTALMAAGITLIEWQGKSFDPLRHDAVLKEETNEYPPNTILEELRKGYLLKSDLIRPTLVKIAIKPAIKEEVKEPQKKTSGVEPKDISFPKKGKN